MNSDSIARLLEPKAINRNISSSRISYPQLGIRKQKTVAISTGEDHRLPWMEFQLALVHCSPNQLSSDILISGNDLEFIAISDCRLEMNPYKVAVPFYMRNHKHGSAQQYFQKTQPRKKIKIAKRIN